MFAEAFSVLFPPRSLEAQYMMVHIYLKIHRLDAAQSALKIMQEKADDAVPTQLARAFVGIESGEGVENALYTLQDLLDKHGQSVLLLNGLATCHMHKGDFEKAERVLQDALLLDNKSVPTRINLLVCAQHLDKPKEKWQRDFNLLSSMASQHPWVVVQQRAEQLFDQAVRVCSK
eukprot:TRINITY_DN8721_c0_g1_i2.p1 TRINITY_DN8721_c0_g1~~TRINITY_DN8721_c0_g1_i2.p1  ORF type:complete len:175 (+),score=36.64 TRINITY_DN8721_c0_g1_i2:177-701(+)